MPAQPGARVTPNYVFMAVHGSDPPALHHDTLRDMTQMDAITHVDKKGGAVHLHFVSLALPAHARAGTKKKKERSTALPSGRHTLKHICGAAPAGCANTAGRVRCRARCPARARTSPGCGGCRYPPPARCPGRRRRSTRRPGASTPAAHGGASQILFRVRVYGLGFQGIAAPWRSCRAETNGLRHLCRKRACTFERRIVKWRNTFRHIAKSNPTHVRQATT